MTYSFRLIALSLAAFVASPAAMAQVSIGADGTVTNGGTVIKPNGVITTGSSTITPNAVMTRDAAGSTSTVILPPTPPVGVTTGYINGSADTLANDNGIIHQGADGSTDLANHAHAVHVNADGTVEVNH